MSFLMFRIRLRGYCCLFSIIVVSLTATRQVVWPGCGEGSVCPLSGMRSETQANSDSQSEAICVANSLFRMSQIIDEVAEVAFQRQFLSSLYDSILQIWPTGVSRSIHLSHSIMELCFTVSPFAQRLQCQWKAANSLSLDTDSVITLAPTNSHTNQSTRRGNLAMEVFHLHPHLVEPC